MRGDTLVTGGSDGSVRVWSLERLVPIHRLAAHDNSVTSLQFDEQRIVSGGSDGRVKIWDIKTGMLVRELSQPADAVWRVVFEEEKAVILANRSQRTIMEVSDRANILCMTPYLLPQVWSFTPPLEAMNVAEKTAHGSQTLATLHQQALVRSNSSDHVNATSEDVVMSETAAASRHHIFGRRGILPRSSSTSK